MCTSLYPPPLRLQDSAHILGQDQRGRTRSQTRKFSESDDKKPAVKRTSTMEQTAKVTWGGGGGGGGGSLLWKHYDAILVLPLFRGSKSISTIESVFGAWKLVL